MSTDNAPDVETERFEFESTNAVTLASAALDNVEMDDVVRIAVEIDRKNDEPEPEPEPESEPEKPQTTEAPVADMPLIVDDDDFGDSPTTRHKSHDEPESESDDDQEEDVRSVEEARNTVERTISRTYPVVEYLYKNGPTVTLRLDKDLGYNASSSLTYLYDAGFVERDTVTPNDGVGRWMYIYRLTDRGRTWFDLQDEPETTYPTEESAGPRDGNLEVYEHAITGNEFQD